MIKKVAKQYGLTELGAKNFYKASLIEFLTNAISSLPLIVFLIYINQAKNQHILISVDKIGAVFIVVDVMLAMHFINYSFLYISSYKESEKVRFNLIDALKKYPLYLLNKEGDTYISNLLVADVTEQERLFSHGMPKIMGNIPFIAMSIIGLSWLNFRLAIIVFSVIPVAMIIFILSNKIERRSHSKYAEVLQEQSDYFQEIIERVPEIKYSNFVETSEKELFDILDKQEVEHKKSELSVATVQGILSVFLRLGVALAIIVGGVLLEKGQLDFIVYLLFILATSKIMLLTNATFEFVSMRRYALNRIERLKKVMNYELQNKEKVEFNNYKFDVEQLSFSYSNQKNVLTDVSFSAEENKVTAIVGPSGSGKSTLFKLLSGLLPYESGKILLGSHTLNEIEESQLYEQVSMVFQDVTLFNTTIFENIKMGNQQVTDEEVFLAGKMAQCDEFCHQLKNGYHTDIGENGSLLSGGQRQRISIARAILKNSPILLLDEVTSGLDFENEFLVQKAIRTLIDGKTVIVIAHRLRTIEFADKIVVLEKGKIIDQGSKNELMESCAVFRDMWNNVNI